MSSESEESEELILESELSLEKLSEEIPESESESTVARLTLPFLDFLLFFFFFQGHFQELYPDLSHLKHFLTARLRIAFITLFNVKPTILSVILSTGS